MNPNTQPVAPPGGYQLGGWYNGQQWNGQSFGAPNVITVGSSAGQTVNPAVVAAGNKAQGLAPGTNEAYLAKVGANPINPVGTTGTPSATTGTSVTADTSKVQAIQDQINKRTEELNKAMLGVNDNPFYSEATRVGKINSFKEQYNADMAPLNAQLKIETDSYNALLKANESAGKTTLKTFTDANGNVNAIAFDPQGNIVNQTQIEGVAKGKTGTSSKITTADKQALLGGVTSDARDGNTLQEIINYYKAQGLSEAEIYQAYNQNSIYGPAQETLAEVKQGKFKTQ